MVFEKVYRCKGTTCCKRRCKRKNKSLKFCSLHQKQEEKCCICLDTINQKCTLGCTHSFCKGCIIEWMCTSSTIVYSDCPLCRSWINDTALHVKAIDYGITQQKFVYIVETHYNTGNLSDEEIDILYDNEILAPQYMILDEWETKKEHINFIEKMDTWCYYSLMKVNSPQDWEYFSQNRHLVFFD